MDIGSLKTRANQLKRRTLTIYFATCDPRMTFTVRLLAILVAAYVLSPIDLIPDFIPVIGYLDDIVLVPLGLALVMRLTPREVIETADLKAQHAVEKPVSYLAGACVVVIWLVVLWLFARWMLAIFMD